MKRPLKQLAREHFKKAVLSSGQLEQLESLMADNEPAILTACSRRTRWLGVSAVATIAFLISTFMLFQPHNVDPISISEKIALEVALNHIKLKPLDIKTNNIDGLRQYFTDLEFMPAESQLLANADLSILGGRYCSIQQAPAAQIRLQQPNSEKLKTLYQTEYLKNVFGPLPVLENGDSPNTVNVKGLQVQIWVEKGLLFALIEEPGLEIIRPDPSKKKE